jgi:hypothetical protein
MELTEIYNDDYLTEEEENSDDDKYINLYKFISTELRKNSALKNYLFQLGWFEKEDIILLESDWILYIYNLLDEKKKIIMKKNYLRDIKKITNNSNFNFISS